MKNSVIKRFIVLFLLIFVSCNSFAALTFYIEEYSVVRNTISSTALNLDILDYILDSNQGYAFQLEKGNSFTVPLFEIGTTENSIEPDDTNHKPISVSFNLKHDGIDFDAMLIGESFGDNPSDNVRIAWNAPVEVNFGVDNIGKLLIDLPNVEFNTPGSAIISGTITLLEVPEPATLLLLTLGGLAIRRKPQKFMKDNKK